MSIEINERLQEAFEAAKNIAKILEHIGCDSDIALHQGFEVVSDFTRLPFSKRPVSPFYTMYSDEHKRLFGTFGT